MGDSYNHSLREVILVTSEMGLTVGEYRNIEEANDNMVECTNLAFWDFMRLDRHTKNEHHALVPYRFNPSSIEDYRYTDLECRRTTFNSLIEIARSKRFSSERLATLRKMMELLDQVKSDDYPAVYELVYLLGSWGTQEGLASYFVMQNGEIPYQHTELTHYVKVVRDALSGEYNKHCGYLSLAHRLIDLGDAGVPNELIPPSAFYYDYPPHGTRVIAWQHNNPNEKWLGVMPATNYVGWYSVRIDPIDTMEAQIERRQLGLKKLSQDMWFDDVVPIDLVKFYLERPELFNRHRSLLQIPIMQKPGDWWKSFAYHG